MYLHQISSSAWKKAPQRDVRHSGDGFDGMPDQLTNTETEARKAEKWSVFGTSEASKRAVIMLSTGFWLVFARTYYCVIHLSLDML